jgi:hypothetical protein
MEVQTLKNGQWTVLQMLMFTPYSGGQLLAVKASDMVAELDMKMGKGRG